MSFGGIVRRSYTIRSASISTAKLIIRKCTVSKHPETLSFEQKKRNYVQDNVRRHTSILTHQKLRESAWSALMHPPYSTDLASSDYIILLMANDLLMKNSSQEKRLKTNCLSCFPIGTSVAMKCWYSHIITFKIFYIATTSKMVILDQSCIFLTMLNKTFV